MIRQAIEVIEEQAVALDMAGELAARDLVLATVRGLEDLDYLRTPCQSLSDLFPTLDGVNG